MKRSKPEAPPERPVPSVPFDEALRRMLAAPPAHKKAAKKAAKKIK